MDIVKNPKCGIDGIAGVRIWQRSQISALVRSRAYRPALFRGSNAAASLKYVHPIEPIDFRELFRGSNAATSLK